MFALLEIKDNPTDFLSRIKFKFNRPLPELSKINVKGGAPFYSLSIYRSECGERFETVSEILGRCSQYLVLCDDYDIPNTTNVNLYTPKKLPQLVLINTAFEFIKKLSIEPSSLSLGFIDERAVFCDSLARFTDFASIIRVYTKLPEKYMMISDELFSSCGVSIIVTDYIESVCECSLCISPANNYNRKLNSTFSYSDKCGRRKIYRGREVSLPYDIANLKPQKTDSLLFASALYELCGVTGLKALVFNRLEEVELNN